MEMRILAMGFLGVADQTMGYNPPLFKVESIFIKGVNADPYARYERGLAMERQKRFTEKVCRYMARKAVRTLYPVNS